MIGKELFQIYAPEGAKWTSWVRPVPFVAIDYYERKPAFQFQERKAIFMKEYQEDMAIFVDLPGQESIELGISLAKIGYRPIPVFNGVDVQQGTLGTTDTCLVESALINGGKKLKAIPLSLKANPAFLLDSARMNRYRAKASMFDNSWDLYGQDIPSIEYFKQNGIHKILVVGEEIHSDLKKIFLKFQKEGFEILTTDGFSPIHKIILKKTFKERLEKEEL